MKKILQKNVTMLKKSINSLRNSFRFLKKDEQKRHKIMTERRQTDEDYQS